MKDVNKVVLTGRLTRDVELKYTSSGTAVANIRLATTRSVKRGAEYVDETAFVDVTVWGKRAEFLAQDAGKGSLVLVEGHLRLDEWADNKTGAKRSKLFVEAEGAKGLGGARERASDPGRDAPTDIPRDPDGGNEAGDPAYDDIPF